METNFAYGPIIVIIFQCLYLMVVVQKGNQTIGFRFAAPTFYPMRENETQMNSFIFNILITNATSLAICMFCVNEYSVYTKPTFIFHLTTKFLYSSFMFNITQYKIVGMTMLFMSLISVMVNYCSGGYRIRVESL